MRDGRTTGLVAGAGVLILALTAVWRPLPLLIWNASGSVPKGLYAVRPVTSLSVGLLVVAQPPEGLARYLAAGGYLPRPLPLLKHIAAVQGQTVCRRGLTLSIDGKVTARALERDHAGRRLPVWSGCKQVGRGEVFLLNPAQPASLDGRYFGMLPTRVIVGRAVPIWTSRER